MTTGYYRHALLRPLRALAASTHNAGLLGPMTLGIEVTEPALAAGCGLGNIDPQHTDGRSDAAAIDFALDWRLPPPGALMVTLRPDADALGAMAVLDMRSAGQPVTHDCKTRIDAISTADRFARGPWPGLRRLPECEKEMITALDGGHIVGPVAAAASDARLALDKRVSLLRRWLETGSPPPLQLAAMQARARALWYALESGQLRMSLSIPDRLAVAEGEADGALFLGYRLAPVVIAFNPRFAFPSGGFGRKFTIAQYREGHADFGAIIRGLNAEEAGWGGSSTIAGSPQGVSSRLTLDHVKHIVTAALLADD